MRTAGIFILIVCYSILAGLPPSLLRATALAAVLMVQRDAGRKTTLARSLLLAVFAIVLMDESMLYSGGFQLSCTAVLAIALIGLPLMRAIRARLRRGIASRVCLFFLTPLLITTAVNVLTLPLLLSFFGRAPLLAPLCNLLMFIPVTLMLYLGLIYAVLPIGPVRAVVAPPINLLADIMHDVPVRISSGPQPAILSGNLCVPLYIVAVAMLVSALRMAGKRRAFSLVGALVLFAGSIIAGGGGRVMNESIGGDAALEPIELTPNVLFFPHCVVVIEEDIVRREAMTAARGLWKMGIGRVETVVICPAGLGWGDGVEWILSWIDFEKAIYNPYLTASGDRLMDILHARRIEAISWRRSGSLDTCGWKLRIAAPAYPPPRGSAVRLKDARIRVEYRPPGDFVEIEN